MLDLLKDIVGHTQNLGFLNIVKITGDDAATKIDSMAEDRSVIMYGEVNAPVPEMKGIFGMPQLNKLKTHLDCPEYKENARIDIVSADRNGEEIPVGLHFENQAGDFKNDYRFMNTEIINEKLKTVKFRGVTWHIEVEPTVAAIQRFNFQASANAEHPTFLTKVENGNLKFVFGDQSTHGGEFVFAANVAGTLNKAWTWPVSQVLSILKISDANNTKLGISNDGAMQITLDSGLATYKYIIPAQA
jgi:hypothetical protein